MTLNPNSLICPRCKKLERQDVLDSRPDKDGVRRRRRCPCGHRFTTRERIIGNVGPGGVLRQIEFGTRPKFDHRVREWGDPVL